MIPRAEDARFRAWVCAALLALGAVGCRETPTPFVVKQTLARQLPGARFDLQFHLRLGRLGLGVTRGVLDWVGDDAREAYDLIEPLRHIEVATYRVEGLPPADHWPRLHLEAARRLERRDWQMAVRVAEDESCTWVFHRARPDGDLTHLFVVALDGDELTLVGLEGELAPWLMDRVAGAPGSFARSIAL